MNFLERLQEAEYVSREDDDGSEKQCGWPPCGNSKLIDDDYFEEPFRFCEKFNMRVNDYDSCKYHDSLKWERSNSRIAGIITFLFFVILIAFISFLR